LVQHFQGIFVVLAGVLFYIQTAPIFDVTHIGVRGNLHLRPEEIVEHLNIPAHTNIFQIQLDEIQKRIETLQWVKTATVFRSVPHKIRIDIVEREPFALVKFDQLHIIDKEGVVLGALASGSAITLPIITGMFVEQITMEGERTQLQYALHAIDQVMHASPPIVRDVRKILVQSLENVTFMSYDVSFPEIRISLAEYGVNIQRLQQMYPTLYEQNVASIDARFERRIIVSPNKS
jgi:cell division septal protein FtsQ